MYHVNMKKLIFQVFYRYFELLCLRVEENIRKPNEKKKKFLPGHYPFFLTV